MDSRVAQGWCLVAVLVVLWATVGPAQASFPGRNGTIVYGWTNANKYVGSPTSIRTVDPHSGAGGVLRDCPLRTADPAVAYPDCWLSAPRYSPDGARLAFASMRFAYPAGQAWQSQPGLATMAADGAQLEEHATANSYAVLAWSPTGDRLLLGRQLGAAGDLQSPSAMFLVSLEGAELRRVGPEGAGSADWSSRGQIAFARFRDPCPPRCSDLYVTRLDGSPRRLTHRGGSSPSWSPHGTKLAFVRYAGSRQDIYLMRRNGRGLRRLIRGGNSPAWSPNGKWVAFIRNGDIYVVRTSGRGRRRLVDELGPDSEFGLGPQVTSLDWQPLPRR